MHAKLALVVLVLGYHHGCGVLLRRFEPRDDRARFVQVILDEVARLDRIVTSLLQYARPRTPELEAGALATCVGRVRELTADAVTQAGIQVELSVAPRLPEIRKSLCI